MQWKNINYSIVSGFFNQRIKILNDINLELRNGTILGLVGPNGAGKTSTLNIGAGLIAPDSGKITVNGSPINKMESKKKIGYVSETQHPHKHLKLKEYLFMLGRLSGIRQNILNDRIEIVLDLFELKDMSRRMIVNFSKGQIQRINLAQSLIHNPDILILDEPMSGLDSYWRYQLKIFLKSFKASGRSVIFSSHILSDIENIADQAALIDKGSITDIIPASGISKALYSNPEKKDFDNILLEIKQ